MELFATLTSAYLAFQSLPLLLTPRLIVSMTISEPRRITDLETYLCRSSGLTLLLLSALILLLTNTLPVAIVPPISDSDDPNSPSKNPYAYPTALVTTIYHFLTAFYLYAQLTYTWNFAFTCGLIASGFLFCLGVWTTMFGGDPISRSKRTGADKRTSNFPFSNTESAKFQKKESKEREKRRSLGTRSKSGRID